MKTDFVVWLVIRHWKIGKCGNAFDYLAWLWYRLLKSDPGHRNFGNGTDVKASLLVMPIEALAFSSPPSNTEFLCVSEFHNVNNLQITTWKEQGIVKQWLRISWYHYTLQILRVFIKAPPLFPVYPLGISCIKIEFFGI
jgi:hypothetical protein